MLLTGGTTARAEQGGDVGDEMEVGDGSVQGHAPVNKCRERQSLERRDSAKKQKEKARARGRPDGSVAGGRWSAPAARGPGGHRSLLGVAERRRGRAEEVHGNGAAGA